MHLHKKPHHTLRDIKRDLRVIYNAHDGAVPDMTRLSSRSRSRFRAFLIKGIILLCVLSAVAWSGFFLFSGGLFEKQESLSVVIDGPTEVKAGQPVAYAIRYENTGDVPLATLELSMSFPPGFHLISATPEANEKRLWVIGSLTPKSDGVVTLNGVFLSEVPSTERLQALFNFKPANFNSTFQQIQTAKIDVRESVVNLELKGPEKALPGDELEYTITVGHTEKDPIFNLRVLPTLPTDFTITKTEPAFETGKTFWNVSNLNPNQPKTFLLKGEYTSSANGSQMMKAGVGFVEEDIYIKQQEKEWASEIMGGSIGFHLILNGSNKDQSLDLGKTIRGSIDYANQGTDTAEQVSFVLTIEGNGKTVPINWEKADLHGAKRSGSEIIWDANVLGTLKRVKPKDSEIVDFTLPLLNKIEPKHADRITLKLTTLIGKIANVSAPRSVESTPIVISLNTNVVFYSESRYFNEEGQPIGTGALPPKVGGNTTYRIFWEARNSLHDLSGVKISTTLPTNVTWLDKKLTDIGSIEFNPTTRSVTWTISKLPASIPKAGAWFDVSILPTTSDVGKFVKLTNTNSFVAKDLVTGDELTDSKPQLTTELGTDEFANGKGAVVK